MISHLNFFRYVELDGEFIETPFQHFEEVSPEVATVISGMPRAIGVISIASIRVVFGGGSVYNLRGLPDSHQIGG